MFDFLTHLFDTSGFPPRWHCGWWTTGHGWLHILSDLGVWSAFVAISCVLAYFVLRNRDVPFRRIFWLFGAFLLACGTTHLMEALLFWWPAYRLAGVIKLLTAIVSWGTVLALVAVIPKALAMRNHEELECVTESMAAAVTRCSRDLRYLWVSKPYADWIGRPRDEIIGSPILDIVGEEAFRQLRPRFEQVLAGKKVQYEEEVPYRGLGLRWTTAVYTPTFDKAGVPDGWVAAVMDISERRKMEEALRDSEQRFARFMHHLPGLAWIKDLQGRYVYANDAAEKAFRTPRTELYGHTDDEVFPPETAARFQENDQAALASGTGVQVIETLEHEDGIVHHSLVSKFPILRSHGQAALLGGMAIDVTDRLRAEDALKEADRRKDEFLAMLAHELRNPLAPIRNALHIMKQPGADGAVVQRVREMMERQVQHMTRMVDDLLDVSRITRGKIELRKEVVDLDSVVSRTVETAHPLFEDRRQELVVDLPFEPVRLEADPTRLEQILANLLNNAAKYTDQGGHIWLSARREGSELVLRVKDTGMGVPADLLCHIFEPFVQSDRVLHRCQGGLGIGLTLVRSLVEMHGGTVQAHSEGPGKGSEFVVRLPALAQMQPTGGVREAGEGPEPVRAASQRRILVVDDNVDVAESLTLLLRLDGHDVRVAHDGPAALAAVDAAWPEIVFLDIGMPVMDGYEVAQRLRQRPGFGNLLLVALTGWGQAEDRRRSQEAGFTHHLVKPVEPDAVRQLLARPQSQARSQSSG